MRRWISVALFFCMAALLAAAPASAAVLKIGEPVGPGVVAKTLDGKDVKIAELVQGKKTLLVFFNTVCKNCFSELRQVDKLYKKDGKVNVFAVGVDMQGEKILNRFQEQYQFSIPILVDPTFSVPMAFGLSFTPSSVVIGEDGKVQDIAGGYDEATQAKLDGLFK